VGPTAHPLDPESNERRSGGPDPFGPMSERAPRGSGPDPFGPMSG
jgi:tRNA (guanine37-N1)-methyltransferase